MSRIPWLWNILSHYWLEIETSFCFFLACENIRFSSLFTEEKRMFSQASFFPARWARQRSPKIIVRDNFGTKKTNLLLWWWRYTHTLNRFSRSGISTFRHWSQGLANETWNPKASHATPHFWREMQYEIRRRTFGRSTSTPTESRHTTCLLGGKSLMPCLDLSVLPRYWS